MAVNETRIGVKNIILIVFINVIIIATGMSCSPKKDAIKNINSEISNISNTSAEEIKSEVDDISKNTQEYSSSEDTIENDIDNFSIPRTYEEALELMNKLDIKNVILEIIIINGESYIVVETKESGLTVGTDAETKIYDIPDESGNILLTLPYKNQIKATVIAIVEEPYLDDHGYEEHWVKIRMEDDSVGWVRGDYTSSDREGKKYQTRKNVWLWENYISYWI
jgi:hypothetical protein